MSRELNFQDGIDVIKYQDSTNHLNLSLTDDGKPFDISQADSMTLRIGNSNGYLMSKNIDISNVSDPQSGNISIHLDEDTMTKLVPDDYNIEVWVDINPISIIPESNDVVVAVSDKGLDTSQAIFPSDGNLSFTVDDNIKSSPSNTINAYVVDDVWDDIQKWKTDTANSISTTLSSQLLSEITHWQGDISDSLKKDLLQALMNDESTIQKQLNDILTHSLDDLINKEVADAKTDISQQLNTAMINDVANQVAGLKTQVSNDLHNQLTTELSTELSDAIQQWENSTDSDLNNKLAQAIVQKTNDMQGTLSTQLTNYLAGQLSNYEQNATSTITTNITNQLNQSVANLFAQEDSSLRADLEGLVKGTIQNDVTNTLQQMQQNGDIYATKAEFDNFTSQINSTIQNLDIADITKQVANINAQLQNLPNISQKQVNMFGTDFNSYTEPGTYTLYGMTDNLPNGLKEGVLTVNIRDEFSEQMQMFYDRKGNLYFRGYQSYPSPTWDTWTMPSNVSNAISSVSSSVAANSNGISSLQTSVSANSSNISNLQTSVAANSNGVSSAANLATSLASSLQNSVSSNANAISNATGSINTVANQLQTSINQMSSALNNYNGNTLVASGFVNQGTDFNTLMTDGIYSLNYLPSTSFTNAFYPGAGFNLIVIESENYLTQMVMSNDTTSNTARINYRIFANNWWSRWIQIGTLDDINNVSSNTLSFKGDIPGNTLSQVTTNGIYNLAGKAFTDWGGNQLWGQLTVVNTGGVCNQTIRNNTGNMWIQTLNSWGNTGFQQIH